MSKHPFHLVSPSAWPILASLSSLLFTSGLVLSWSNRGSGLLVAGTLCLLLVSSLWWASVSWEATILGLHTLRVQSGLRLGMFLFIVSEVFFFVSFFWAYLHCSLSPNIELGSLWPPAGLSSLDAFSIPLLNTFVLLTSGATVTWSHSSLQSGLISSCFSSLCFTILLGVCFSLLQGYEYRYCSFCISDSAYGSCFYLSTGFHGLHVLIGTLFLFISLVRVFLLHYTPIRHIGFEFACWYWHFVDVVWILLFLVVYVWGS